MSAARRPRSRRSSADPAMTPPSQSLPLPQPRDEPHNAAFYLNHVLPPSRLARSFPLPLLCVVSAALLALSFLFLPAVAAWLAWLLLGLLRLLLFAVCALLFALWWCQSALLYMPSFMGRHHLQRATKHNTPGFVSPDEHALPYTTEWLVSPDGVTLHAWLLTQPVPSARPTLVFFHGNAGNVGFRLPNAKSLYRLCGLNVLMLEYRGYGNSGGTPSEEGLRRDARCALSWLRQAGRSRGIDADNLFLFGRSLGGAVAFDVAASAGSSAGIRGVIVENTFTSIADMVLVLVARVAAAVTRGQAHAVEADSAGRRGGLLERAVRALLFAFMTSHWDTEARLPTVRCPVLLISGDRDELVPASHMRRLHDRLRQQGGEVEWLSIAGGQHNDTYMRGVSQGYWQRFADFVDKHRKRSDAERGESNATTSGVSNGAHVTPPTSN